jgi:hypothetical protein
MKVTGIQVALLGMAVWFSTTLPIPIYAEDGDALLSTLQQGIQAAERALLNLRVDGTCRVERWNQQQQKWEVTNERSVTAWYDGMPGGKIRIDVHKSRAAWRDGPVPFLEESYGLAWNGHMGQKLVTETGSPDDPVRALSGEITSTLSPALRSECATGWAQSLYGVFEPYGGRLSVAFVHASRGLVELRTAETTYNRIKCVQLQYFIQRKLVHTWYIDPARNYALVGGQTIAGDGVTFNRTVDALAEPASGVYYPSKAHLDIRAADGSNYEQSTFEATRIVANDPSFSDDVFTIKWPVGTTVEDKIAKNVFVAGKGEAKPEVPEQRPQLEPAPAVQSAAPTGSGHQRSADRLRVVAFVIGALAVLALVMIGAVRLSRRK